MTITEILNIWNDLGVFSYVIPFLLIFAIIYAILEKSKILGDEKAVSAISGRGILTMRSAMRLKNARYTQIDDDILCEGYTR